MTSNNDHTDHSEHFVIKKDVVVEFEEFTKKSSKKFEVISNGKSVKVEASALDDAHSLTRRWALGNEICVAPGAGDPLTFRVTYGKRMGLRGCFGTRKDVIEMKLGYNVIADKLKNSGEADIVLLESTCTVSVKVGRVDADSGISETLIDGLKPLLPEKVQEFIASADTFLQDVEPLSSILENVPVTEEAWQFIEDAIETLGQAHPLAKAVLTAISIPYKLLKNENEFKNDIGDLAETMRFTAKCVADVGDHAKIVSAREQLVSITKTLRDAAQYVESYVHKGKIGQFVGAQFSKQLQGYADDLVEQKSRFQIAMIIQIARDSDKIASMTEDEFLRKHLRPVEDDSQARFCLDGTRTLILGEIRSWLQDRNSKENILWLEGPPGAGKSTVANTITKKLSRKSPFCVVFSCRRDMPRLRDPNNIWPTLAFDLASKHTGVKAALMAAVNENKDAFRYLTIVEQFKTLILDPLVSDWKETNLLSRTPSYPVIIIDALDECYTGDDSDWDYLLKSLACWSELRSTAVKFIVTSRNLDDLCRRLKGTSHPVRLTTGDDVSEESKADVGVFLRSNFAEIRTRWATGLSDSHADWPGERAIQQMTDYAAGLFIWADMVVKYIGSRTVGNDRDERLQEVLKDVETPASTGIEGASQVDRLYARIVFEAFNHSRSLERVRAKGVLATVLLAKEPQRIEELVVLLSTDSWDARNVTVSTLQMLSPIIPSRDVDDELRVCHRTVSDFLLSRKRSEAAIKYVLEQQRPGAKDRESDLQSFIIDPEQEERNLALACMRLLCREFAKDADNARELAKQPSKSFGYAFDHLSEHLEGAALERIAPENLGSLVNAMKVAFECLKRRIGNLMLVKKDAVALITCIRDAVDILILCIDHDRIVEQPKVEDLRQEVTKCAKNLDIVRGKFQITMIEHLASRSSDAFLRMRLQPADQTVFDSPCLEGTRTSVLNGAKEWMENADAPNILWIVGGPGAGKSTIAKTLVDEFGKDAGKLYAKAIAKRDFEDRRDPMRIWNTLAYDAASSGSHNGLKGSIMDKLFEESGNSYDILTEALKDQQHLSAIFIIDALDECITENNGWALLQTLAGWVDLPRSLKLVVTSRDIPEIHKVFANVSTSISLQADSQQSKKEAESDMETYFRTKFKEELVADDARLHWTQEGVIRQLIGDAADSFIWAKMFVELVKLNPRFREDDILKHNVSGSDRNVDFLYAKVLFDVLGPLPEKERELFRTVLAFIVFAKNPLREADLVDLLQALPSLLSSDETQLSVANVVKELCSVISIGDNELLRIPHKSFVDFLLDRDHDRSLSAMKQLLPAGPDPHSFIVNRKEDNAKITIACLQLMNNTLKFNACGIETSHTLNDEISDLEARISVNISTSLVYACLFWAEHLEDCSRDDQQFCGQVEPLLEKLLNENLLYWLEILSLTKAVPSARRSLQITQLFFVGCSNELAKVAEDAYRFVMIFEEPITAAVPHIYLSALPFCPSDSWIARNYGPQYPNVLSVVKGRRMDSDWDTHAAMSDTHTDPGFSVAFFPGGRKLASRSGDRTVRIWDVRTGHALAAPFTGHDSGVECSAISPDGSQIASGDSSGVLRIWDSNTGACPLGSIEAHSLPIWSVAFSPDGSRIVTGSSDKTVKVWNVATGDLCLGPLTGHTSDVMSVAFSIDSAFIASGSDDETIRIWDARTGESQREPLTGHNNRVRCVTFSPDTRYLASASSDKTICLWGVEQGFSPICSIAVGSRVISIAFSPNSNCLVTGSENGELRFWNVRSGMIEQIGDTIHGHTDIVQSVAFAPDGQSVASGSYDCSIKIWRVPSSSTQPPATAAIREGYRSSVDLNWEALDSRGCPVLGDNSFIDRDGWMRSSRRDDADRLFWVPKDNRKYCWGNGNIGIIHKNVTSFDFRRFVHGEDWTKCRTSTGTEAV